MKAVLTLRGEEIPNLEVTIALPKKYCLGEGYVDTSTLRDEGYDCLLNFPDGYGFLNRVIPSDNGIEVRLEQKKEFYP